MPLPIIRRKRKQYLLLLLILQMTRQIPSIRSRHSMRTSHYRVDVVATVFGYFVTLTIGYSLSIHRNICGLQCWSLNG